MKNCIRVGASCALFVAASAHAQDVGVGACELHVWPTENYVGINTGLLSGLGVLGALADQSAHKSRVATVKDMMREYLGPDVQIDELQKASVTESLGLSGYRVIVEPATPSKEEAKKDAALKTSLKELNTKLKSGERLSSSMSSCYAELVGLTIFYHKAMMYGSNLFAEWAFRDYGRDGSKLPKVYRGSVKNPLEDFPAKSVDKVDAAKLEIRDAYAKDFKEYVAKKVHGAAAGATAR